jgi:glutathione S-transferase
MRRLIHVFMSPACRVARLALGEKGIPYSLSAADDAQAHLPVLAEDDGTAITGLWAIVDHLEGMYPDNPTLPHDPLERAEALRLFEWLMTQFHEAVTRRIVFEKAAPAHTGAGDRRGPSMDSVRKGRNTLAEAFDTLGALAEERGYLACREATLADFAFAAHVSALDYFGEIPWADFPQINDWYARMKSRPSFRPLLADRLPGQPPVTHYAELDF